MTDNNVSPIDPLACQTMAAQVATKRADWQRQIENQTIRCNVSAWKVASRAHRKLGVPLPPVAERAQRMYEALVECIAQTSRNAS